MNKEIQEEIIMESGSVSQSEVTQQENETSKHKDPNSTTLTTNKDHSVSSPTKSPPAVLQQDVKQSLSHMQVLSCELLSDIQNKMSKIKNNSALHMLNLNTLYENCHHVLREEEDMRLANNRRAEQEAKHELEENLLNVVHFMESLKEKTTKEQVRMLGVRLKTLSLIEGLDGCEPPVHLRLSKEMTHIVKPVPEKIEFDPDSAHPSLRLSPDLKQVKFENSLIKEVNKNCFEPGLYVLGKPGFKSGRHYWEVDVGSKSSWIIGVVQETVERKGVWELSSANGYWVLRKQDHNVFYGIGDSFVTLKLETLPMRIGVCLDLFKNHLAFYDADTTGLIFQISVCGGQRLFPFFCPGVPVCEEDWCALTLCT